MDPAESSPRAWCALVVRVPARHAETLAAELAAIGRGVESRRLDHREEELRAYLHDPGQAGELRAWAERRLRSLGVDLRACSFEVREVEDGRWVERYQESLRPFPLGTRFTVHPRGRVEVEDGRLPLLLVPGRAFGTGEHETTQLCVEQLERRVGAGQAWLDLGCGSGILLLVARALGAARVRGREIDPVAASVAREVLCRNGLRDDEAVAHGGLEGLEHGCWDGAVCNISTTFVRMHAEELAGLPRAGGTLIVSGILEDDVPGLAASFGRAGLRELERATRGPWAVLALERG